MNRIVEEGTTVQSNDKSRLMNIRFSQLPFCPIKWFLSIPSGTAPKSRKPFGFAYFTSVGTTVHTVFQNIIQSIELPYKFELIADWKCKSCGNVHAFSVKPEVCSKCGSDMLNFEEHEIDITWSNRRVRAIGHVDLILRYPVGKSAYSYVVVDFKTTSLRASSAKVMKVSESYKFQLLSYVAAIQHTRNVTVSGAALVYIPRDSPFRHRTVVLPFDSQTLKSMGKHLSKSSKQLQELQEIKVIIGLEPYILSRPCRIAITPEHSGCKFEKECAGNDSGCRKSLISVINKSTLPIYHSVGSSTH